MKTLVLTFAIFFTLCLHVNGQVTDSTIERKLTHYLKTNLQEKIHVHTDKNSYIVGEIIWFKIYDVEAYTNHLVTLSKVVYIELIDDQNQPVLQAKIPMDKGMGSGNLYLPISLKSGNFILRAYTNWMKNFDVDYFFHKTLTISNTLQAAAPSKRTTVSPSPTVHFFPEGGNLVNKLKSKVAFKAVDEFGKAVDIEGAVITDQNDTIVRFRSTQFGMSSFYFTPFAGQKYRAVIKPSIGKVFQVSIPEALLKGAVTNVETKGDSVTVNIQSNGEPLKGFTLFVHSGHNLIYKKTISDQQLTATISIPLRSLGDGITHLTLFNAGSKPVCERLYFKRPTSLLELAIKTDQQKFSKRQKVNIGVSQSQNGKPISGHFSVAVFQADTVDQNDDIAASLWITSELKGKIENAAWYLKEAPIEATDLLMLTHGWRRFVWKDVLEEVEPKFEHQPELLGPVISGRITSSKTTLSSYLTIPGKNPQFYVARSDNHGNFSFLTKNFYGKRKLIVQIDPRVDSLATLSVGSPFSTRFANRSEAFNYQNADALLKRSVAMQVHNAFHAKNLIKEDLPSDTTIFYKNADKKYALDDYVRFATMDEVLREYVFEVLLTRKNNYNQLSIYDSGTRQFLTGAPLILVDGLPLFDEGNALVKLNPKILKNLEIVTSGYGYGDQIFDGIVSAKTYNGNLSGIEISKQALQVDFEALQAKREFYAPMYPDDISRSSRLADYRHTLLWSPNNQIDANGRASLSFFTGDVEGNYVIVVQALNANGGAGSGFATLRVSGKVKAER